MACPATACVPCRGLWELGQYSFQASYQDETGMAFEDIDSDGNGMLTVWITFILQWPVFMALAWYLEQVLDSGIGVRRHWLFPFTCFRGRHAPRPCGPRHGSSCWKCMPDPSLVCSGDGAANAPADAEVL